MKHIVFYSGGMGSWATANRVIQRHGKENVILLFTDTQMEDEDLYRFLDDTAKDFGIEITKIADGRDVWEVFRDRRFIGNSKIAPCSHVLKQEQSQKWVEENYSPDECILYLGIDWTEAHRREKPIKNWEPYEVRFPMCEEPYLSKDEVRAELKKHGIKVPRLYNFATHNNCGGFCVRGGQGHFVSLLQNMPERFAYHERKEQEMREYLGRDDVSILTRKRNGQKETLTLKQLREEYEAGGEQLDLFDIGGCGCFVE